MQCYTFGREVRRGWGLHRGEGKPFLELGETGRGRRQVRLPLAREVAAEWYARMTEPRPACPHGPALWCEPCSPAIQAWEQRQRAVAQGVMIADLERRGNLLIVVPTEPGKDANPQRCGLVIRDQSGYRGGWALEQSDARILAEGLCAQGAAGRMGGGAEVLVLLEPGQSLWIKRTGRLYGAPSTVVLQWNGLELASRLPEEVEADTAQHLPAQEIL